jgi:hypothetical protein
MLQLSKPCSHGTYSLASDVFKHLPNEIRANRSVLLLDVPAESNRPWAALYSLHRVDSTYFVRDTAHRMLWI